MNTRMNKAELRIVSIMAHIVNAMEVVCIHLCACVCVIFVEGLV